MAVQPFHAHRCNSTRLLRPHTSRGFTLIELLVVISIVALLVAILLPSLAKARKQVRVIQCLSQERQMSIAALGYATDDKGYALPYNSRTTHTGAAPNDEDTERKAWWMCDIARYMGGGNWDQYDPSQWPSKPNPVDKAIPGLLCPETYDPENAYWLSKAYGRSYAYNTLVTTGRPWRPGAESWSPTTSTWYVPPVNLDQMQGPMDKIVMIGDGWEYGARGWGTYNTAATSTSWSARNHGYGRINFVFMDGHASNIVKGDRNDLQLYDRKIASYFAWSLGF